MAGLDDEMILLQCSESILTCQICMERFDSPRILPCQHTFCKDCVISLVKKHCLDESNAIVKPDFPCPNCRKDCKIRCKTYEDVNKLKAFPENLLLKDLLEADEAKASGTTVKGKRFLSEASMAKSYEILCRYKRMVTAMRNLLHTWPSREPRFTHPLQYCTDIRNKLSNFLHNLTSIADTPDSIPSSDKSDRSIRTVLGQITEEERFLSNTYTVESVCRLANEIDNTPCCLEYIPIIAPIIPILRRAKAQEQATHGRRTNMHGERFGTHGPFPSHEPSHAPRRENPTHAAQSNEGHRRRTDDQAANEKRVSRCLWLLVWLCLTVFVLFIAVNNSGM